MREVEVIVENAGTNLSAYIEGAPVITVGDTVKEIEKNMKEAIALYLESCKELGCEACDLFKGEYRLVFRLDAATFINNYSNIFTKAALSRITGINERQLWHYAAGVHKPRKSQMEKIQRGVSQLCQELSAVRV